MTVAVPELTFAEWQNWLSDFTYFGNRARPTTKDELIDLVTWAVQSGRQLRAVGSGHSHSICARPRDLYVDMTGIAGPFARVEWLKRPPGSGEHLVRVRAGTTIKELNRLHLHTMDPPLGLINAGTFDGQTIAGAINTGTHGTGARLGNLADMVVSVDIVTVTADDDGSADVRMRRIEPTDGVTDRGTFERDHDRHGMVLEQDDDLFHAVVLGYGCLGVVYAYTLRVVDEYWLREEMELVEWPELARQLAAPARTDDGEVPAVADSARHVWFMLNIAEMQGSRATSSPACFVIRRHVADALTRSPFWENEPWPPERELDGWREFLQDVGGVDATRDHDRMGGQIRNALENDVGEPAFRGGLRRSVSYIVHRREREDHPPDAAPEPPPIALSVEIAVPATDVVAALDAAIDCAQRSELFYIAPWGVRFSAASPHFLSPAYGRATAWIEVAILLPTPIFNPQRELAQVREEIAKPELTEIEAALCHRGALDGRPHLGKHQTMDRGRLADAFPALDRWLTAYRRFNPFGTFDNDFTDQLGLDRVEPPAGDANDATWLEPVLHVMMT